MMIARFLVRGQTVAIASLLSFAAAACSSDQMVAPTPPAAQPSAPSASLFSAFNAFQRYVAIGTSISAGVQSDGLIFATQAASWPAQLDAAAARLLRQPYIGGTGCHSPVLTPLLLAVRLSGESALTPARNLSCSPLLPGVTLPVDNVSLNGALAAEAFALTPQAAVALDPDNAAIYARVLQPGMTQVSTMLARNPTIVSVELGSNEVLGAAISGDATEPFPLSTLAAFAVPYHGVLDDVQSKTSTAVVVGLIADLAHSPAFRTGAELWADRAEFALFNVNLSTNCQGSESANLIFVPLNVATAAAAGLSAAQHGAGPVQFTCADLGPGVLTPMEAGKITTRMHEISAQIQAEAASRHFAYFSLGALYDRPDAKGPFSLSKLMTSLAPFGPYFSADGVHPNRAGQTILARAAAQALNDMYGIGIPLP
jgi:hypothetical protein